MNIMDKALEVHKALIALARKYNVTMICDKMWIVDLDTGDAVASTRRVGPKSEVSE